MYKCTNCGRIQDDNFICQDCGSIDLEPVETDDSDFDYPFDDEEF